MLNSFQSRYTALFAVIALYLCPLLIVTWYFTAFSFSPTNWTGLSLGFLLTSLGSLIIYFLLFQRDQVVLPVSTDLAIERESIDGSIRVQEQVQKYERLLEERQKEVDNFKQEAERHFIQYQSLLQEFHAYKSQSTISSEEQNHLLEELRELNAEQSEMIEKKQIQISQLETKVSDLAYEIKTLLELAESSSRFSSTRSPSVVEIPSGRGEEEQQVVEEEKIARTGDEAASQLKKYLAIAQRITSSHHFGKGHSSPFKDLSVDSFALDLRRLCDNLRNESGSAVILYSPKEDALIFANNMIKNLLGWSPEKFIQNFHEIVQEGMEGWKAGINALSSKQDVQMRLLLKTRSGQDILTHAYLGLIPTGVFRNYVLAVLIPV